MPFLAHEVNIDSCTLYIMLSVSFTVGQSLAPMEHYDSAFQY